jgi:hypothetical protein
MMLTFMRFLYMLHWFNNLVVEWIDFLIRYANYKSLRVFLVALVSRWKCQCYNSLVHRWMAATLIDFYINIFAISVRYLQISVIIQSNIVNFMGVGMLWFDYHKIALKREISKLHILCHTYHKKTLLINSCLKIPEGPTC